jgi:xanthine dehydrogenase YagR molybdenum-binding subunit
MLFGKVLRSRHANAKIVSIDMSAAEKMPGVKAVLLMVNPGAEVKWVGAELCAVAAVDEPTAEDAVRAIKVVYEKLPHLVIDNDLSKAGQNAKPAAARRRAILIKFRRRGSDNRRFLRRPGDHSLLSGVARFGLRVGRR